MLSSSAAEGMEAAFAINNALLKRMLRVMRCGITSPANPRLLIAFGRETEPVN
jgi:hypothetical protein